MPRIAVPPVDELSEASSSGIEAVQKQLGVVPNLFRLIANSPAALTGYLELSGALSSTLDAKTRERIALATAQVNGCDYCLSAHTYLGLNVAGISAEEIAQNRAGGSSDAKAAAAVRFAALVTEARGHVSDADVATVRLAGFQDAEIVEIVALVAANCFTNFLNEVAKTDIDFPVVAAATAA